jgi:mitochondrial distribution and morphology protein 31
MSSAALGLGHLLRRRRDRSVIDRYGLVRNFFIQQASAGQPRTQAVVSFSRFQRVTITAASTAAITHAKGSWRWQFASTAAEFKTSTSSVRLPRPSQLTHHRCFHTTGRIAQERPPTNENRPPSADSNSNRHSGQPGPPTQPDPRPLENYSKFFRQLALSLPHVHRPTRDDFLNAATGFWQRIRIRFKWLTIRSFRKYNADDISAFITWFFMSQTLWLFVGT